MPATLQPVIVTPSLPLLLAFYKALLGAVEISRMPEDGPAFYVGLQIGNALDPDGNTVNLTERRCDIGPAGSVP